MEKFVSLCSTVLGLICATPVIRMCVSLKNGYLKAANDKPNTLGLKVNRYTNVLEMRVAFMSFMNISKTDILQILDKIFIKTIIELNIYG